MLPQTTTVSTNRSIFINPNFNKANATHINPNFLVMKPTPSTIHLNPEFIQKSIIVKQNHNAAISVSVPVQCATVGINPQTKALNKIITKSRTKIVREPVQEPPSSPKKVNSTISETNNRPLIKIGLRKLIRSNVVLSVPTLPKQQSQKSSSVKSLRITSLSTGKYKIDRRRNVLPNSKLVNKFRKKSFVARYALRRSLENIPIIKANNTNSKTASSMPYKSNSRMHPHRKMEILRINGIQYKSTRNKLQRNDSLTSTATVSNKNLSKPGERTLFVRGTKFLLDKDGFKITRASTQHVQKGCRANSLKRIDIGGLTYIAKSKNEFVRTGSHLIRNHVWLAKQKSISMLSRSLVKSNVPCAIFQRVGKCAAFERGKCMKVHDKMQISICQKFLRGECTQSDCLLSHNVSLSKMPVCKFFLQGCCVRSDCPYLHKKVSQNTEICSDFLKGFCKLAQDCNKRHEFVCPDFESKGKCEKVKCRFCNKKKKQKIITPAVKDDQQQIKVSVPNIINPLLGTEQDAKLISNLQDQEQTTFNTRYFKEESTKLTNADGGADVMKQQNTNPINENLNRNQKYETCEPSTTVIKPSRPKLGDLPAFIPLS